MMDNAGVSNRHLQRVARTAKRADESDAALAAAIVAARDAGATLRELAAATGGRFSSPESIRSLLAAARKGDA